MFERIQKVFGSEFKELKLPLAKWEECEAFPGCVTVFLCCRATKAADIGAFFYTMISGRFFPGKRVMVRKAEHIPFEVGDEQFYFGEISMEVTGSKDRLMVLERLPFIKRELEYGVLSDAHMRYVLQQSETIDHQKISLVRWDLAQLQRRYAKQVGSGIFRELQHLHLATNQEFWSVRQSRHLSRIVGAFYAGRREVQRTIQLFPKRRHLVLKLMHGELNYPFGKKVILGVTIAVACDREFERLESERIVEAASSIIPDVEIVPGSFLDYQDSGDPIRMIYLEMQKRDRSRFSRVEYKQLRSDLPIELKEYIACLTHPLFYFRNEEEVLRHILTLGREVQTVDDLPQLVASFQEQKKETLTFNIIMVRPIRKDTSCEWSLPQDIVCQIDMEQVVGQVNKEVDKIAHVFTLTFDKTPFFRKDHAIDLLKARQYVVNVLTDLFGDVRDYNGGLILKQNEVLEATRDLLNYQERSQEQLFESLFYSLSPIVMQSHLQPKIVRSFFSLLLEAIDDELKKGKKYKIRFLKKQGCDFIFVRAEDFTFKGELERSIQALGFDSFQLVTAFLTIHGSFYFGYICLDMDMSRQLRETVQRALFDWEKMRRSRQILRINLPRSFSTLDPRIGGDRRSGILTRMLYEGLMQLDKQGKPVLAVAERLNVSSDSKTYIFTLRESRWSNGAEVTARDFEYAWKKSLAPDFHSRFVTMYFHPIRHAVAAKQGLCSLDDVGIYVKDDRTLIVELEKPAPYFLHFLTHWTYSPLYREIDRINPDWASVRSNKEMICNGPFKMVPSDNREELCLIKNPCYRESSAVRLERIQICSIRQPQTSFAMFEEDELDWIGDPLCELPAEEVARLSKEGRLKSQPGAAIFWAWCNTQQFPFHSKKIRKAFAYAIDRQELIDTSIHGYGEPAMAVLAPTMTHFSGPKFRDADREHARALFEEGLQELGTTKEELPPIVYRHIRLQNDERVANILAEQWKEVFEIDVILDNTPWESYNLPSGSEKGHHLAGLTWYPIADDAMCPFQSFRDRFNLFNISFWENPAYTQLLDRISCCLDSDLRARLIHQMEELFLEEMPAIPLYYPDYHYLIRPGLQETVVTKFGQLDFKRAYISENKD